MEVDRQDEIESPLVEDFLDCDQLGSDSDGDSTSSSSPRKTLKRLRIHVDMASAQYLTRGAHHPDRTDGLPICSSGPSTVPYSPDLDPYSAASGVSSFNYPAAADPTLLTPVSSAGSPPLQNKPPTKPMRSYNSSQSSCPVSQGPAVPRYYSSYDVNTSSQGSSPMTVHPAVTEASHFGIAPYMANTPPGSGNQPSSPKNEMPPIDPYLGHFTVSGANEGDVTHHSFHDYPHAFSVEVAPPGAFLGQQQVPIGTPHMRHRMPSNGQTPALPQPHPSQFRPQTAPRIGGIEDLRDPAVLLGAYPSHAVLSPGRRPQPRKKPSPARKASRTPKTTPQVGTDGQANGQFNEDDKEELMLAENAPEDDKYLFQLRKEFLSEKGKGMWEEMKAKYSEKHQGNWEKAALQMKVSRAVAKFGVWPEREIERLKEAYQYYEEKRYQLIIARMKENGGCRVWDWKPQHIEAMLVKMGMEEPTIDEKTGTRRRKKVARRRASPQNGSHQHSAMMGDWSNGLGLHQAFQGHAHHVAAGRQAPYDMIPDDASIAPTFTSEQENEYLDQIFSKPIKTEGSLSPETMELTYDDEASSKPSAGHEVSQQRSERVARQACEQLIQQQPYATQ
ncbi:hypothetical protein MMYC01_207020 [Madurella mycetomatis]|uniref:Uncharacterized protein n=1 Tax=Madurella mycetomatis TaxID=100816 RepID=A0A175W3G1_9PEZI|nr:hypothetical protein MMYC01_207020 [Madurella mycetomatis]